MAQKPSIPKGTRDFGPEEMIRRNYIFDTIKKVLASTHAAGSNKITTHELAERMGSTVRNANRSNS